MGIAGLPPNRCACGIPSLVTAKTDASGASQSPAPCWARLDRAGTNGFREADQRWWLREHRFRPYTPRTVGIPSEPNRRRIAVAVTSDGRRVQLPIGSDEVTLLSLIRSILVGFESLLGLLITGSRRENGGTRRDRRD